MRIFNIAFCGTPDFALPSLELLANHPHIRLLKVITQPDRPAGRGQHLVAPPVADYAKKHGLSLVQTENINKDESLQHELSQLNLDFIVILAFAQILSEKVLGIPRLGHFNIHTSLLPLYRGAAPIQHALLNGDSKTGVTIQKVVKKLDAGDIVHQIETPVGATETLPQLYTRLKFLSAQALSEFIQQLLDDKIHYRVQDEALVTHAPPLEKQKGFLDFRNETTSCILNKIRALMPWPGTWCFLGEKRAKIHEAQIIPARIAPGEVDTRFGTLSVGCADGAVRLHLIQLEGKKVCTDTDFLKGARSIPLINP
jgi:methionyl-tRNA formyltransferase